MTTGRKSWVDWRGHAEADLDGQDEPAGRVAEDVQGGAEVEFLVDHRARVGLDAVECDLLLVGGSGTRPRPRCGAGTSRRSRRRRQCRRPRWRGGASASYPGGPVRMWKMPKARRPPKAEAIDCAA